jgi:uncharacterized protein with NAD-binding domain and iron-sulfur cluster
LLAKVAIFKGLSGGGKMTMRTGQNPKVIIAGGGLAGLVCAKNLIDAGYQVELVEAEPQLGGRTASWLDEDGDHVESGIHTFCVL